MTDTFYPKNPLNYFCDICNFITVNKKDYKRHLLTAKHEKATSDLQKNDTNTQYCLFKCLCGNSYKYRQSLWKHKKICETIKNPKGSAPETELSGIKALTELVKDVVKQNVEITQQNVDLTQQMVEMCKIHPSQICTTNINSHNKAFNLNFFLNDTCKDAMNITDFVSSIQPQLSDLEHTGQNGFVDGISNVVINHLKGVYTHNRPIHCSDVKREIIYIKENDQWIKDDENNGKMIKFIKEIAHKNMKNIPEWVKNHPDCYDSESKQNDKYLKIVLNSMSGSTEQEQKTNINKIISKVLKEIYINKNV
jgi:hypothetical protein